MECEGAQEFLLHSVVFHKLRRQLNEIPPYIGTAEALESGVGKHAMKRMSELMKECLHLAQRQQSRLFGSRLSQIHHHAYVRTYVHALAVNPLTLEFGHPCTALLALARMEVGVEHSQIRAVLVEHLVCLNVGMIHLDVLVLLECDAVEACGESEHALYNFRQFEVWAQHFCIEVEFAHL